MIKSIQSLPGPAGGYRVAFRLNAQAVQPSCWSPVYGTLEELYEAHPDLVPELPLPASVSAPEVESQGEVKAESSKGKPRPKKETDV